MADDRDQQFLLITRILSVSTKNVDLDRTQIRAARALLDMTQSELARAASVGLSTVVDFEKSRREVSAQTIQAMRGALEYAGVEFIGENGGGRGVRLSKRTPHRK